MMGCVYCGGELTDSLVLCPSCRNRKPAETDKGEPDPAPANHASVCMGCAEPLETEPADELLGLCPRCSEAYGQAEDWQVDTGAGRW